MKRLQLTVTTCLATSLWMAAPANAQTVSQDERAGAPDNTGPVGADIIVTATKRAESLTEVPVTMQVFTEEMIIDRGITSPGDFLNMTPNVVFVADNAGEVFVNIRGQTGARNGDPNVAIVIDGVTLTSLKPFNQDLFAIEQIEVLKGPQSALYGRNAAAGAIVINSRKPTEDLSAEVIASYANFDTKRLSATLAGPITPTLGFSIAGTVRDTDGPFSNITTGEKVLRNRVMGGRGRLVFDNDEGLSVDFKIGIQDTKGGGIAYNAQIAGAGIGGFPADPPILDANFANIDFVSNVRGIFDETFWDPTLKIDYDFGFATLTSISAYNQLNQYYGSDAVPYIPDTGTEGALIQQYTYLDKNFSQEVRITSRGDQRFRWQAGFYYLHYTRDQTTNLMLDTDGTIPGSPRTLNPPGSTHPSVSFGNPYYKTTSYAPYASFEYDITDALELRLAGRYDTEKRSVRELATPEINPLTGASYNICVALTGRNYDACINKRTFKQFEPKASLTYKFSSDASAYVSYGKGFKSGGFNPIGAHEALRQAAINAGVDPNSVFVEDDYDKEVSESFELGTKLQLLNRRLSLNLSAFKTKINGAQQYELAPSIGLQAIVGIDKVDIKGIDFDFNLNTLSGLNVYGSAGYVHGRISEFKGNPDFVGNVAPGAFEYTFSLGVAQDIDLTHDLTLIPRVEYTRFGPIWRNANNTPGTRRDPLDLLRARLTLRSASGFDITAFGDNLTNKTYFQETVPLLGYFSVHYRGMPRTYGIEVRKTF